MSDNVRVLPRGEKRFITVDLAQTLATGDSLASAPAVKATRRKGGTDVSAGETDALIADSPAPAIDGTAVTFWTVLMPEDYETGMYDVEVSCTSTNGEVVESYPPLVLVVV